MWVEIYRSSSPDEFREYRMVLDAMGLPHRTQQGPEGISLLVPGELQDRAREELVRFEEENRTWRSEPLVAPPVVSRGWLAATLYVGVLATFFVLQVNEVGAVDWRGAGMTRAQAIRDGEWWRTITALTLHSDMTHLTGNLLSGALGNLLNAMLRDASHSSLGASTAVFGGLGVLAAHQWARRKRSRVPGLKRWAPLVIGGVFLGYLGAARDPQVDVVAHCAGMLSGLLLGAALGRCSPDEGLPVIWQRIFVATVLLILLVAWSFALRVV